MGLKWLVVLLGAFALLHFTVGEEEFPEIEGDKSYYPKQLF
jgi:hypothetical protein